MDGQQDGHGHGHGQQDPQVLQVLLVLWVLEVRPEVLRVLWVLQVQGAN